MSYKALINSNLNRAFNMIKDLATELSYVKKTGAEFDFGTGEVSSGVSTTSIIKTVIIDARQSGRSDSGHKSVTKQIMFKSKDVPDLSIFDHVVIEGEIWKIAPVSQNSGFVVLATITKEV